MNDRNRRPIAPAASLTVTHLTPTLDIGGLERMLLALCREQRRQGIEAKVILVGKASGQLADAFAAEGIPVACLPKGRGFSPSLVWRIHRALPGDPGAVVHSHDLMALIYAAFVKALRFGRMNLVHTQHGFRHLLTSRRTRIYERIFPAFADRLVSVAEDLRATYRRLGQPDRRLAVITNGVDFRSEEGHAQPAKNRRELLEAHGLPPELAGRKWVLCLGRVAAGKGQETLLEAWAWVDGGLAAQATLLFVGPESEPGRLAELRRHAGPGSYFAGPTLEPQPWLQAADLFVSASEFEGLPMAGLEAAALRRPMLLSQIPGHEVFRGWAAFFPMGDAAAAARQIERFLREGSLGEGTSQAETLAGLEASGGTGRMEREYFRLYEEVRSENGH